MQGKPRSQIVLLESSLEEKTEPFRYDQTILSTREGFDYTLMKDKKKVDGDVGLIFLTQRGSY